MEQTPKQVADWAAYIEGVRREGYAQGHAAGRVEGITEGYQKAMDDASQAIGLAVEGFADLIRKRLASDSGTPSQETEKRPLRRLRLRPRVVDAITWTGKETNRQLVLAAVRAIPGMRPVGIVQWLEQAGAKPNRNSILTTIKRLRGTEIERRADGGYYEIERAEDAA